MKIQSFYGKRRTTPRIVQRLPEAFDSDDVDEIIILPPEIDDAAVDSE